MKPQNDQKASQLCSRPLFHVFFFLRCSRVTHGHRRLDWLGRERMTCTVLSLISPRVNCAASRFLRAEPWEDDEDLGRLRHPSAPACSLMLVVYRKLFSDLLPIDLMRRKFHLERRHMWTSLHHLTHGRPIGVLGPRL